MSNMKEHYIKDVGKITYTYGVDLEEHTKVIEKQQKRIAELEQDLEFTTKTANELIEIKHKLEQELAELKEKDNYHLRYELAGADETITNLKQQLAEKDKEIEKLKQRYTILENENGKLTTELIMDKYKKAQKEVSFGKQLAIQELEKVKELLLDEYKKYPIVYDKTNDIVAGALDRDKVNEIIDQQIKELKGEKDGNNK